jgi:drug/metabolite transporter (DMT)-like permease
MKTKSASGYVYIALCTLIFSTMEVMLKMPAVSGVFKPMQITVERFLIGGLCLVPFAVSALKKRGVRLGGQDMRALALTGFLCVPVSMVLYQLAIVYGKASVVAVLFSGNPLFVTLLAFIILGEAIRWNNILALALEICGIVAIINPFSPSADISIPSVVMAIASALVFALYGVLGKKLTVRCGGIVVTCGSFLFGSAELLALLLLGYLGPVQSVFNSAGLSMFCSVPLVKGINLTTLPYFLFICVVNSAAGYVCHMMAMEKTSAATTSLVFFFKPIIAPLIALAVLGEAITVPMIIGIAFFLVGSLCSIVPRMAAEKRAAAEPEEVREELEFEAEAEAVDIE